MKHIQTKHSNRTLVGAPSDRSTLIEGTRPMENAIIRPTDPNSIGCFIKGNNTRRIQDVDDHTEKKGGDWCDKCKQNKQTKNEEIKQKQNRSRALQSRACRRKSSQIKRKINAKKMN